MIFKGLSNLLSIPCCAFNIFLDIYGALEGESVVAESIRGVPNLWRSENFFVVPDSSTSVYDFNLWPIVTANPTAKSTSQDRMDLIRSVLGSGDNDLHIYAGQSSLLWTSQFRCGREVRRYTRRILHIAHAPVRCRFPPLHPQRPSDQCTIYCIQMPICSTATYSLQYFTTTVWMMKIGIANSDGASSLTFVENGGTSYTNHSFT